MDCIVGKIRHPLQEVPPNDSGVVSQPLRSGIDTTPESSANHSGVVYGMMVTG